MRQNIIEQLKVALVIIINLVLVAALLFAFYKYMGIGITNMYNQNMNDIRNISKSYSDLSGMVLDNYKTGVRDIIKYCGSTDSTLDEALEYIHNMNSDASVNFQILGMDYSGFSSEKLPDGMSSRFREVSYASAEYDNLTAAFDKVNGDIMYTPCYLDRVSAFKSVGLCSALSLRTDEDGKCEDYILLVSISLDSLLRHTSYHSQYENTASFIITEDGYLIVSSNGYDGDSFNTYLDEFCDMQHDIIPFDEDMAQGSFTCKSKDDESYVYVYSRIEDYELVYLLCVPEASFISYDDPSFHSVILIVLLILFAFNITWLIIMNKLLKRSAENEKRANRAKTDFLSRMSHDMRTPLNGIIGMSGFISNASTLEEAKEYNDGIIESSKYLQLLVNDTLDMNRIESGKTVLTPVVTDVTDLFELIEHDLDMLIKDKKLSYTAEISGQYNSILVDKIRFKQIFMNLISNSIKFTPNGGCIKVTRTSISSDNGILHDRYTVSDTGIGMSEEFMGIMFEPFEQEAQGVSVTYEGSGLGLCIVKKFCELMDATVSCESKLGAGTVFTLDFNYQYASNKQEPGDMPDGKNKYPKLRGLNIIIAEDNEINLIIAKKLTEQLGITSVCVKNGKEALDMFNNSPSGTFNAILMDIRMPVMDGIEATRAIRKLQKADARTIPIIATTADVFSEEISIMLSAGINTHIPKPLNLLLVANAVYDSVFPPKTI